MPLRQIAALALTACLFALGLQRAAAAPPRPLMPIGGWCSPPASAVTPEAYHRMADAGFTLVLPPCGGTTVALNQKILRLADRFHMKVLVQDPRMPLTSTAEPELTERLKQIVDSYRRYPALLGYFLTDEPSAAQFPALASVTQALRRLDPDHIVYINLFPSYATDNRQAQPSQLSADTYSAYLSTFISTVHPQVLSFDSYPFLQSGFRPDYLGNLAAVASAASAGSPPAAMWQVVQALQHLSYRKMNELELRYEAMQALAYGAQGLIYFTYWPPTGPGFTYTSGIISPDGSPGSIYSAVAAVNRDTQTLARWLCGDERVGTFETAPVPPGTRPLTSDLPMQVEGNAPITASLFRDGNGYLYVLLASRDFQAAHSAQLHVDCGSHRLQTFDLEKARWIDVTPQRDGAGRAVLPVALDAAGVFLCRWY